MYTIRVEATFSAAHALTHYQGKCERLHGHNYRVRAWVRGAKLDDGGLLVDFGLLKASLRAVLANFDHRNLNDITVFKGDPSAERIAKLIFEHLAQDLVSRGIDPGLLFAVDVFETALNMARWEAAGHSQSLDD